MGRRNQKLPSTTPKSLADRLSQACARRDLEGAAQCMTELVAMRPEDRREIFLIRSKLRDPGGQSKEDCIAYFEQAAFLQNAIAAVKVGGLLSESYNAARELQSLLTAGIAINALMTQNIMALPLLDHWKRSRQARVFRVAVFIETEHHYIEKAIAANAWQADGFRMDRVPHTELRAMTGSPANVSNAIDEYVESMELVLRYDFFVRRDEPWGDADPQVPVYGSQEFLVLNLMAQMWRRYADTWDAVKHTDHGVVVPNSSVVALRPNNEDVFRREAVGFYRYKDIMGVNVGLDMIGVDRYSDSSAALSPIVKSVRIPKAAEVWNGAVDLPRLVQACSDTFVLNRLWLDLERRHFAEIADELHVGPESASVPYPEWAQVDASFRVLSRIFDLAIQAQTHTNDTPDPTRSVVRVRRVDLVRVLTAVTPKVQPSSVERFVGIVTFDPTRKKLELWDQHLLPFAENTLLLLPKMSGSGDPVRAIENYIDQWRQADFDRRGPVFESVMERVIQRSGRMQVQHGAALKGSIKCEVDLLAVWDGRIMLFECKCMKSVHSPADTHRARSTIDQAIQQLRVRRKLLLDEWPSVRQNLGLLQGAAQPLREEDVCCVVVTNYLGMSGYVNDGVVVCDEWMLKRFFDTPGYYYEVHRQEGNVVAFADAMPKDTPLNGSVSDFMSYLRESPQVQRVYNGISVVDELVGNFGEAKLAVKRSRADYANVPPLTPTQALPGPIWDGLKPESPGR